MATEQKETKNAAAQGVPKKKKSKLLFIAVAVVLLVVGAGGFVGWKHLKPASADAEGIHDGKDRTNKHNDPGDEEGDVARNGETKKRNHSPEQGATINFEPFLVNLADKEASRYVKTSIRLLVPSKEAAESIAKGEILMPRMRDTILSLLSAKTAEEITSSEGKEKLKTEILKHVNEYLPDGGAREVFFTDFVVQF